MLAGILTLGKNGHPAVDVNVPDNDGMIRTTKSHGAALRSDVVRYEGGGGVLEDADEFVHCHSSTLKDTGVCARPHYSAAVVGIFLTAKHKQPG